MIYGNNLLYAGGFDSVICCSSAAGFHGMCMKGSNKLDFYVKTSNPPENSLYYRFFSISSFDDIEIEEVNGIQLTTPKQSILDMIKYDCYMEFVCDSLDWWSRKYGSLSEIENLLKKNDLYSKYLEEYYPYLEDSRNGWK